MTQRPNTPATLRLEITADPRWLSYIRHCVSGITNHLDCSADDAVQIEMSVDEACANSIDAMRLITGENQQAYICIEVWTEASQVLIIIQDCANDFREAFNRAQPISDYTDRTQRRGYGLQIIKTFMDNVHYEHVPDEGNRLYLRKQFAQSAIEA